MEDQAWSGVSVVPIILPGRPHSSAELSGWIGFWKTSHNLPGYGLNVIFNLIFKRRAAYQISFFYRFLSSAKEEKSQPSAVLLVPVFLIVLTTRFLPDVQQVLIVYCHVNLLPLHFSPVASTTFVAIYTCLRKLLTEYLKYVNKFNL